MLNSVWLEQTGRLFCPGMPFLHSQPCCQERYTLVGVETPRFRQVSAGHGVVAHSLMKLKFQGELLKGLRRCFLSETSSDDEFKCSLGNISRSRFWFLQPSLLPYCCVGVRVDRKTQHIHKRPRERGRGFWTGRRLHSVNRERTQRSSTGVLSGACLKGLLMRGPGTGVRWWKPGSGVLRWSPGKAAPSRARGRKERGEAPPQHGWAEPWHIPYRPFLFPAWEEATSVSTPARPCRPVTLPVFNTTRQIHRLQCFVFFLFFWQSDNRQWVRLITTSIMSRSETSLQFYTHELPVLK